MKRSKCSTPILIASLTLCAIFAASVVSIRSTAVGGERAGTPTGSVKPIRGVDVIVQKDPGNTSIRQAQSDAEGSFTVGDLTPGLYQVSLVCKARCQSMNDIGRSGVEFTLTGAKESNFKRTISKQQLVDGIKFPFEIGGKGGKGHVKGGINVIGGGS